MQTTLQYDRLLTESQTNRVNNSTSSGALTPFVCVQASEIRITFFINKEVGRMLIIV